MFRLVSRNGDHFTYEAQLWDSERGRHYMATCADRIMRDASGKVRGLLNTAPSVSYYSKLKGALKI